MARTYTIHLVNFGWDAEARPTTLDAAIAECRRLGFDSSVWTDVEGETEQVGSYSALRGWRGLIGEAIAFHDDEAAGAAEMKRDDDAAYHRARARAFRRLVIEDQKARNEPR